MHRAVRKTEQDRFLSRFMDDGLPAGHDKNIFRTPIKMLASNSGFPFALDADKDCCVGCSVTFCRKSFRQQLDEGSDGRHSVPTVVRVRIAHLEAVAGVLFVPLLHSFQGLPGAGIGISEQRRDR